jgi:hypothetical protein
MLTLPLLFFLLCEKFVTHYCISHQPALRLKFLIIAHVTSVLGPNNEFGSLDNIAEKTIQNNPGQDGFPTGRLLPHTAL